MNAKRTSLARFKSGHSQAVRQNSGWLPWGDLGVGTGDSLFGLEPRGCRRLTFHVAGKLTRLERLLPRSERTEVEGVIRLRTGAIRKEQLRPAAGPGGGEALAQCTS